jgi:hypothetical protein
MPHSISATLVCESQMEPSVVPSKGASRTTAPLVPRVVDVQRGCPIRCTDPGCHRAADREMTYPGCQSRACQAGESTAQSDTVIPAPGNSPLLVHGGPVPPWPRMPSDSPRHNPGLGREGVVVSLPGFRRARCRSPTARGYRSPVAGATALDAPRRSSWRTHNGNVVVTPWMARGDI